MNPETPVCSVMGGRHNSTMSAGDREPTPASVVEVIQSDRDAAVDLAHALSMSASDFTNGACDTFVQAFARNRLKATSVAIASALAVADRRLNLCFQRVDGRGIHDAQATLSEIAALAANPTPTSDDRKGLVERLREALSLLRQTAVEVNGKFGKDGPTWERFSDRITNADNALALSTLKPATSEVERVTALLEQSEAHEGLSVMVQCTDLRAILAALAGKDVEP